MTPERKVKAAITKVLKDMKGKGVPLWWCTPIGSPFGGSGVPDLLICLQGRFIAVEVKAPGRLRETTALQREQISAIWAARGEAWVIDDISQFVEVIRIYVGLLSERVRHKL